MAELLLAPKKKKLFTLLDLCVSSLRRGHANLLCIVPILTDGTSEEGHTVVSLTVGYLGNSVHSRTPGSFPKGVGNIGWEKSCQHPKGFPGRPRP
jgi:hypothetical protein